MASADEVYFQKVPWCARLLADSNYALTPNTSRQLKQSTEDNFFAETLCTSRTIEYCLTFYRHPDDRASPTVHEVRMLFALRGGLNGHPHILHGGVIASILDETTGVLLTLNKDRRREIEPSAPRPESFTAYMHIDYKKPAPTPSDALVIAEIVSIEGRKTLLRATIQDGQGTVFATGETLFIEVTPKL